MVVLGMVVLGMVVLGLVVLGLVVLGLVILGLVVLGLVILGLLQVPFFFLSLIPTFTDLFSLVSQFSYRHLVPYPQHDKVKQLNVLIFPSALLSWGIINALYFFSIL
jgi:hypothetical protein